MRDRSNSEWMTIAATVTASAATIGAIAYAVNSKRSTQDDEPGLESVDSLREQYAQRSDGVTYDAEIQRRIRRRLERVCSAPQAIHVECEDGIATLYGDALEREIDDIVTSIAVVPGVREVRNQLDLHAQSVPTTATESDESSSTAATLIRLAAGATGASLLAWAFDRRDALGAIAAALGGACIGSAFPDTQGGGRWAARIERRLSSQTPADIARSGVDDSRQHEPLIPSSTGFGTPTRH